VRTGPALAVITMCAVVAAPATTAWPSAGMARSCGVDDLRASWGPVAGTAGTEAAALSLTNISSTTCVMRGYLGLRRLSAARQVMTTHVQHRGSLNGVFPDPGARRIVLAPGKPTSAEITWRDNSTSGSVCRRSFYLRLTLPSRPARLTVRTGSAHGPGRSNAISACGGDLTLTALQPGPRPAKR
jgi:hypothetical protein